MSRVTVTNPYDLLTDENEDRTNVPAPKKEQKPTAPAAKPAAKTAATGVAKPAAAKPAAPKAEGTKAPAKTDTKAAPKPAGGNNQVVKPAPIRDSNQNLQERDKESRAPRDKRDHRQPTTGDKKRAFDRKSGTGRVAGEVKRGGQGKGNWGADIDTSAEAIKEVKEKTPEEEGEENKEEKVTVEGEKKEGEKKEGETKEETPAEPEVFTLDEYLAKKSKASIAGVEALKPRTVNAEEFGAAGFVALQREDSAPKKEKKAAAPAAEKTEKPSGEKKENLAAKLLNFASHQDQRRSDRPPRRDYNDRQGERRAPRQGDRSGPRPPRNNNNAAPVSSPPVQEKDFPTLNVKA